MDEFKFRDGCLYVRLDGAGHLALTGVALRGEDETTAHIPARPQAGQLIF